MCSDCGGNWEGEEAVKGETPPPRRLTPPPPKPPVTKTGVKKTS